MTNKAKQELEFKTRREQCVRTLIGVGYSNIARDMERTQGREGLEYIEHLIRNLLRTGGPDQPPQRARAFADVLRSVETMYGLV